MKIKLLFGLAIFAAIIAPSCGGSEPEIPGTTSIEASRAFWLRAKPIVERQIAEVGQPLTDLIIQSDSELRPKELSEWYETLLGVGPLLNDSYDALLLLNAPLGRADRWHQAQLSAWGTRLDSIEILAVKWRKVELSACVNNVLGINNFNRMTAEEIIARLGAEGVCRKGGFTGSENDFELMSQLWDQSILSGLEADRLQGDLLQWLSSESGPVQP